MRYSALTLLVPCALVLSACTTPVTPAFKDIGTRSGPCIEVARTPWRNNFMITVFSIAVMT